MRSADKEDDDPLRRKDGRRSTRSETSNTVNVKTGSIIFFDGKDAISNIIKMGTLGKWSHVGIAIVMTPEFKNNFVMFVQRMKKLSDNMIIPMPSSHLPISDHRFGMLNNVGGYAAFIKKEFFKERNRMNSLNYTVFQKKISEKTGGVYYSPQCDPSEKAKTTQHYLNPEECVKCVIADLNNIVYHWKNDRKNAFDRTKKHFHKVGDDTTSDDDKKDAPYYHDYLDMKDELGEKLITHKTTSQTFNKSSSGKLTMGNSTLTDTLLSVLSDERTFDIEHVFSKKDDKTSNEHLKNFEKLSSGIVSGHPQIVFLVHVIQVIQAFNLIEMSSLSKAIQNETNGKNNNNNNNNFMKNPYLWESTTDDTPDCYDELTSESVKSVKMTMLNNRLDANSYHAFSKRDILFENSSLKAEHSESVLLKSVSSSTKFESFDNMLSLVEMWDEDETYNDGFSNKQKPPSPSSPFRKGIGNHNAISSIKDEDLTTEPRSQQMLSESRYAHLFRTVSTISRTNDINQNNPISKGKSNNNNNNNTFSGSERDSKKRTYQKILSNRRDYEGPSSSISSLKSGNDFKIQKIYEQHVYKAILCNMLINHGKSYQTTVTDFAMAVLQEYTRCFCCSSSSTNTPDKQNDDAYAYQRADTKGDYSYANTHHDDENSDFFCSELVYQTVMDLKLIVEYRALINNFGLFLNPKQQERARAFYLLTIDDFETEDEYYAFMVALASLLILKCGLVDDFFDIYSQLNKNLNRHNLDLFVKKKDDWSSKSIATKMTDTPIVMSSCCVTPVDLFNLDILACLGVPVNFSEGNYYFDDVNRRRSNL